MHPTRADNHSERRAMLARNAASTMCVVVCFLVRLLLQPVLHSKGPYAAFFIAVILTSWIGGLRVGLVTVGVSLALANIFFVRPKHLIGFDTPDQGINATLFVTVGIAVACVAHAQRQKTLELVESEGRYRRLVDEMGARAEREAMINRVSAAVRAHDSPDDIQNVAVTELGTLLNVDRCYFAIYDLKSGIVNVVNEWCREGIPKIRGEHAFSNTNAMFAELYKGAMTSIVADRDEHGLSEQTIANMKNLAIRARVSTALADTPDIMVTQSEAMAYQRPD